jgi:DNA-binding Lrp family transcriptional regulator
LEFIEACIKDSIDEFSGDPCTAGTLRLIEDRCQETFDTLTNNGVINRYTFTVEAESNGGLNVDAVIGLTYPSDAVTLTLRSSEESRKRVSDEIASFIMTGEE